MEINKETISKYPFFYFSLNGIEFKVDLNNLPHYITNTDVIIPMIESKLSEIRVDVTNYIK
jgi:hypothetical protein